MATQTELERAKSIETELEKMYPNISLEDGVWMKERGNILLHEETPETYKQVTTAGNKYWKRIKITREQREKSIASANKSSETEATIKHDEANED